LVSEENQVALNRLENKIDSLDGLRLWLCLKNEIQQLAHFWGLYSFGYPGGWHMRGMIRVIDRGRIGDHQIAVW
jgi:hypothetical protein